MIVIVVMSNRSQNVESHKTKNNFKDSCEDHFQGFATLIHVCTVNIRMGLDIFVN